MIVADYLRHLHALPPGTVCDLTADAPFLVLSPHSDDETLGCGGLLALAAPTGAGHVAVLTDGVGSHPGSLAYPPARLARVREDETRAALRHLGLQGTEVDFLRGPDTGLPSAGPAFERMVDAVVVIARRIGAGSLFVTWGHDPHCDHEAAAAIAIAAARSLAPIRLWAYPIWGWHLDGTQPIDIAGPTGLRLGIEPVQARKRGALACYASQMSDLVDDDPTGFCFTEAQLAPFLGPFEFYIAMQP